MGKAGGEMLQAKATADTEALRWEGGQHDHSVVPKGRPT